MPDRDDELEYELADGGDDRVGLEELDDDVELVDDLDEDDDEDLDDEFDDLDDAGEDDLDFAVALYYEDGQPVATELPFDVVNDLEELISELGRYPGDGGSLGVVSVAGEFFVLCRVRGKRVQVVLSDVLSATDWPLARDVVDYLDEDVDDDEDEPAPIGDLDMLADLGVDEMALETICLNEDDLDSDELATSVAEALKMGPVLHKIID